MGASRDTYQSNHRKIEEERKYREGKLDRVTKTDMGHDVNILRSFRCDTARRLASKCPHRNNQCNSKEIN